MSFAFLILWSSLLSPQKVEPDAVQQDFQYQAIRNTQRIDDILQRMNALEAGHSRDLEIASQLGRLEEDVKTIQDRQVTVFSLWLAVIAAVVPLVGGWLLNRSEIRSLRSIVEESNKKGGVK